jgi:hypothetical protein
MADGQLAMNTNLASPGLFFKDSNGDLVKTGPVHVGTTAPNATPASGGQAGNSKGELWLDTTGSDYTLKTWDGSAWREIVVTSTMIKDGAIVNADVNASAAIAGTKVAPDFGSQNVVTTGTATAASLNPTGSSVPTNGVYLPAANSVAISTNGTGRLFVDASGNVGVNTASAIAPGGFGYAREFALTAATSGDSSVSINLRGSRTVAGGFGDINFWHQSTSNRAYIQARRGASDSAIDLDFITSGGAGMRLDSSGRLGLGTSTARAGITVGLGGDAIPSAGASTGSALFSNATGAGAYGLVVGATSGGLGYIQAQRADGTATTYDLAVQPNGGRVGIGVTGPTQKLQISDGTLSNFYVAPGYNSGSGTLLAVGGSEYLAFATNGLTNERARIDSSGRLLIGTSSTSAESTVLLQGNSANSTFTSILALCRGSAPSADGLPIGRIHFSDNGHVASAIVEAVRDGGTWTSGSSQPSRLTFSTSSDNSASPTERLRITSLGRSEFRNTDLVYPLTDNAVSLGASAHRWSAVWAANGTIQTSDQRAKTDITDASLGCEFVKTLRPVSYRWTEGGKEDTGNRDENGNYIYESVPGTRTHWGFIAQEVKQAVDDAGVDFGGWVLTDKNDPDSQQALRYDQFIAPLTKALQEALAKIETLEAKVAALEAQ